MVNPARDAIVINSRIDESKPSVYAIYNEAGKLILKGSLQLKSGMDNLIRFPFKPPRGVYILKISGSGKEYVNKILVE